MGDSNPRYTAKHTHAFQACSFNRSDNFPFYINSEREGFEPSEQFNTIQLLSRESDSTTLASLRMIIIFKIISEREGFEPPEACTSTVFKTASFNRSDISPKYCFENIACLEIKVKKKEMLLLKLESEIESSELNLEVFKL